MLSTSSIIGYFALKQPISTEDQELYKSIDYGKKISVNGHTMNVGIFGETHTKTIIYLPGLSQPSPVYEFKPLALELSKNYQIVVIEPFGLGLSDIVEEERTIENISAEIHTAIKELGLNQYYLMAHSLGGLYCLFMANQYPEEVLGFIGIDVTVPGQEVINKIAFNLTQSGILAKIFLMKKGFDTLGVTQLIEKYKPFSIVYKDKNYEYSEKELETIKIISLKRATNKNVYDETMAIETNLTKVHGMKFPNTIPVLNLISSDNVKQNPLWEQLHQEVITETTRSKVVILEGSHMLHHDNKEEFLKEVTEWLN